MRNLAEVDVSKENLRTASVHRAEEVWDVHVAVAAEARRIPVPHEEGRIRLVLGRPHPRARRLEVRLHL